jgi:restriction system protein
MKNQPGPKLIQYFDPILKALKELGGSGTKTEVVNAVAQLNNVSDAERQETLPSGALKLDTDIAFARQYLVWAGYLDASEWEVWSLTEKGQAATGILDADAIQLYKEQRALHCLAKKKGEKDEENEEEDELLQTQEAYKEQVMAILRKLHPKAFERLCQRLLRVSKFEKVDVTGRSGDGGIDGIGIVKVNPFVTFKVLFQCKRCTSAVTSAQVRDFRGAMQGRADKAIILTTGTFTKDAQKEAARDGVPPIELVDGERLIRLFEQLKFGLRPRTTYDVDVGFFEQFGAGLPEHPI